MKSAAVLFALSLAPAWAAQLPRPPAAASAAARAAAPVAAPPATVTPTEKPRLPRQTLSDVESRLDTKLASVGGANDPIDLLGAARGIYLDGYGVVLTAEASLIITPGLNPFRPAMTEPEKEKIRQRKLFLRRRRLRAGIDPERRAAERRLDLVHAAFGECFG